MQLGVALLIAAASGFIALSYEILWYRVVSFTSSGLAASFGLLLVAYLSGLALGARVAGVFCEEGEEAGARQLRIVAVSAFVANIAAWVVVPAFAWSATRWHWPPALTAVALASALLGAILPLVSHFGIKPDDRAGARLSYVYLANIVGSGFGVFLDAWTLEKTSMVVGALGMGMSIILLGLSGGKVTARALTVAGALGVSLLLLRATSALYDQIWERLLYKKTFKGIVEINQGYLKLIGNQKEVRSLLTDPKVEIVIDDGRRWLQRHEQKFDVGVMNTTFHWRAHSTNSSRSTSSTSSAPISRSTASSSSTRRTPPTCSAPASSLSNMACASTTASRSATRPSCSSAIASAARSKRGSSMASRSSISPSRAIAASSTTWSLTPTR